MLSCAYEQLASINGEITEPQWGKQYPYFALKKEPLYQIKRDQQTRTARAQLLVP